MPIRPCPPRPRGVTLLEATIAMAVLAAAALALVTALEAGRAREREAELRLDALDAAESLLQESLRAAVADARRLDGSRRGVPGHPGVEAVLAVQPSSLALPGFAGEASGLLASVSVRGPANGEILRLERFRLVAAEDSP
jgi:type II secretory pathway pseudopilin PulG